MRIKFFSSLSFLFFLSVPILATAASFNYVPMEKIPGFATSGNFCDYITTLYKFGIWAVGVTALLMITLGGYMYIMSAGNTAEAAKAKGVIYDAVFGLALAMLSYLILYEINPNLVQLGSICAPGRRSTAATVPTLTDAPVATTSYLEKYSESEAQSILRNALINFAKCPDSGYVSGCAQLQGIRKETLAEIIKLSSECTADGTSAFKITSGTEAGKHANPSPTAHSHVNGYKVDLSMHSGKLNKCIEETMTYKGLRSDNAKLFQNSRGACYAKEASASGGPHWDVKVDGNGCP